MVEHSSANPNVPGSIPGLVSYRGSWITMRHVSCILHLEWSTTSQGCGCIRFLSPMHNIIPDSYSKREGGNPGNSGLSSQQKMVVYYPRTVWKNSYAEHKVTGKRYNLKKINK